MRHKLLPLILVGTMVFSAACQSIFTSKSSRLMTFDEQALAAGQGAVLMHAINNGGLMATRWVKIDDPRVRESFTVFHSSRHNLRDDLNQYDLVMVPAGTYALYSVYSNCQEGLRPSATDWDETIRPDVASPLGMVSWLRRWTPVNTPGVGLGVGVGMGGGWSGVGVNVGFGVGGADDPGLPVATCNLINAGVENGRPLLASVTVQPGEIVYAGEMEFEFGPDAACQETGNFMTTGESRLYCGAGYMKVAVSDAFLSRARPFLEKTVPALAGRAVVRLMQPGAQVGAL